MTANIYEVFLSIQGEGLWVGRKQAFIRFSGCNLRCRFCDTKYAQVESKTCHLFSRKIENPVSVDGLISALKGKDFHSVSLTGGEPLLSVDFIKEFLSSKEWIIYLETNGTLPHLFSGIADSIDMVAMDIKLPSVSGEKAFWDEHREFLKLCKNCFAKIVVGREIDKDELAYAGRLISDIDPKIPLIIQPADTNMPIAFLLELQEIALSHLSDVRIIPQIHKLMKWK